MSARTLSESPCAPFNPDAVAAAKESADNSTHITDSDRDHEEIVSFSCTLIRGLSTHRADCGCGPPQDHDLASLNAALPSPPLMSTMEHQSESPATEETKDEGHEVKSESGSDIVMSPTWGALLIPPRNCGSAEEGVDGQQLWGDMTYGIRGHTYLADSPSDDTAEPSFSWESFFAALRDNTLPNIDIAAVAH